VNRDSLLGIRVVLNLSSGPNGMHGATANTASILWCS
jgi:hypothetical protein